MVSDDQGGDEIVIIRRQSSALHCSSQDQKDECPSGDKELALAKLISISAAFLSASKAPDGYLLANDHRGPFTADPNFMESVRRDIDPFAWSMLDALVALLRQSNLHRTCEHQVRCQLVVRVRFIISVPAENPLLWRFLNSPSSHVAKIDMHS